MTIKASEISAAITALQDAEDYIARKCAGADSDALLWKIICAKVDLEIALKRIEIQVDKD